MKEVKKQLVLILDVSEALKLSTVKTEFKEYIFLDVKVQTKCKKYRLHALLDFSVQKNFISQAIMLEENIIYKKTTTYINEVEDHSVIVYKYRSIKMHITDI